MGNLLSEVHPELIEQWSERNLPLTPDKITYGSNKIVWWKGACGHEWQTSIKARSNGENCPICSGARVVEGINDLATLKPELAAEWSSKNKTLKPTMVSVGSHKKVIWKGKCGHEWSATVKSRATNGTGCPYCSHNKILVGFNDLASQRPEIAAEWSEKNYPLKGFANEPMRGNLKIVKTSSDGKVEGFAFRITGANGYDVTLETDEKGEIFIEGLRIGEYKISEVNNSASAMYILPADKEAAVQTGSTTVVEMHNELRDTPKTGDDSKLGLWLTLAGVSVAGIAACGIFGFKKKKKKEDN